MIRKENIRDYEVSIWTLQDSFLTVLKPSNVENTGGLENPKITLQDDGENRISFNIPMYIRQNGKFVENPIWHNKTNGNLLVNLRKLKVIFNKKTSDEEVFEFLITKITEAHEGFSKICTVNGESLAFNELGKQGYKITLSEEDLYEENSSRFENGLAAIKNNINYWCDKVFKNSNWKYSIQMDWSGVNGIFEYTAEEYENLTDAAKQEYNQNLESLNWRRRDKIYEDAYVSSWSVVNGNLVPGPVQSSLEKLRIVEAKESNRYNLIQSIAEAFEVFTKFKYYYDENYHIIDREVIFYNNFLNENEVIDLTFKYETQSLSREINAENIVTKMYVKTLEDSSSPSGLISIGDSLINKSGEDYILNFDYLHDIETISDEQYAEISNFITALNKLNKNILSKQNELIQLQQELLDAEIARDTAAAKMKEAANNISDADDFIDFLTDGYEILEASDVNPCYIYLTKQANNTYTGKFSAQYSGINADSIKLYKNFDSTTGGVNTLIEVKYKIEKTNNFATSIILPAKTFSSEEDSSFCYATFQYSPQFAEAKVKQIYQKTLNTQQKLYNKKVQLIDGTNVENPITKKDLGLTRYIDKTEEELDELLEQKEKKIADFENLMGPALREGTWQPEDEYSKYGETHSDIIPISFNGSSSNNSLINFIWDNELFDEEETNYYEYGVNLTKKYYPAIKLNYDYKNGNSVVLSKLADKTFLDNLMFTYQVEDNPGINASPIGRGCRLGFVDYSRDNSSVVTPVLLIEDDILQDLISEYLESNLTTLVDYAIVGESKIELSKSKILTTNIDNLKNVKLSSLAIDDLLVVENSSTEESEDPTISELIKKIVKLDNENCWIKQLSDCTTVYPRLEINSEYLKTGDGEFTISLLKNNKVKKILEEFEDYYVFSRDGKKYVTLKPECLFEAGLPDLSIKVDYIISDAANHIYLDALKIAKENAYPKVSYSISDLAANKNVLHTNYNRIGQLAHINDAELKFENVMGYISAVELDLDRPWQDSITIQNYKNKFEDLFSTIVAQTEEMKSNAAKLNVITGSFTADGQLNSILSDAAIEKSKNKIYNLIAKNADVIANNATSIAAKNKAILASSNVYKVMNGQLGIAFQSNEIDNLEINRDNGLLIEGKIPGTSTNVFFNVTNNRMGFFKGTLSNPSDPLLYFENGDLAVSGNIYAKAGWFGGPRGWIISDGQSQINNGILTAINSANDKSSTASNLTASDLGGLLYSANGKVIFSAGNDSVPPMIVLTANGFGKDANSETVQNHSLFLFDGENLFIKGNITANSGMLGGWYITGDHIGNGSTKGTSSMGIFTGSDNETSPMIWSGGARLNEDINPEAINQALQQRATFYVQMNGHLHATDATIKGDITADSGSIGGWYIGPGYIGNGPSINQSGIGLHVNATGTNAISFWAGGNYVTGSSPNIPFYVTSSGKLHASDADISGTINASSGSFSGRIESVAGMIGGWTITQNQLEAIYEEKEEITERVLRKFYVGLNVPRKENPYILGAGEIPVNADKENWSNLPFRIRHDGTIRMTGANGLEVKTSHATNNVKLTRLGIAFTREKIEENDSLSNLTLYNEEFRRVISIATTSSFAISNIDDSSNGETTNDTTVADLGITSYNVPVNFSYDYTKDNYKYIPSFVFKYNKINLEIHRTSSNTALEIDNYIQLNDKNNNLLLASKNNNVSIGNSDQVSNFIVTGTTTLNGNLTLSRKYILINQPSSSFNYKALYFGPRPSDENALFGDITESGAQIVCIFPKTTTPNVSGYSFEQGSVWIATKN